MLFFSISFQKKIMGVRAQNNMLEHGAWACPRTIKRPRRLPVNSEGPACGPVGKKYVKECPRMKILSNMASIPQICIPIARGIFQKAQERRMRPMDLKERWECPKDLRKSCCHRIKCTVTTFLATFMWRRHLNNETLVITTHKEPEEVSNGTDTQVKS